MKILILTGLTLLLLAGLSVGCKKDDNNEEITPPAPTDSLGAWNYIPLGVSISGVTDIWFTSPQKGFFTTANGSIFTSSDSGKNWAVLVRPVSSIYNIFFVNSQYGFMHSPDSLLVSKNGGDAWTRKKLPVDGDNIDIYFIDPAIGFLLSTNSLYRTADTGNTWTKVRTGGSAAVYFASPSTGYLLAADRKIYKTTNGGINWNQHSTAELAVTGTPTFSVLQFTDANTGWLTTTGKVFKTTDGGINWSNTPVDASSTIDLAFINNNTGYVNTQHAIYKTTNGGSSWTKLAVINTGTHHFVEMHFIDENRGWIGGSGVWRYKP